MRKIIVLSFLLSGCAAQPERIEIQIKPPSSMYKCEVTKLPDTNNLTDKDIASLIAELYKNNKICYNSISAIKDLFE
jgi:uncharacterized lipoprotein YajG